MEAVVKNYEAVCRVAIVKYQHFYISYISLQLQHNYCSLLPTTLDTILTKYWQYLTLINSDEKRQDIWFLK